ncbi:MAG TPA: aldehyde dehydrogenase family protein [Bacillota bacterium]|nr:aldehyde dehydrogenase family protein [Candidatus Fermentithermobacillaceae bacterium]HOB30527.1 aldehyde dehydrogenase family protein [Bacillota bacterium]HOK64230.1 aldehyde dehydrogenase family protein [Bacillota bacterium]HOL11848.1 aldehyde dehydrogenase family protein [Bacillota bacterium]HOQ02908.1 aldehyde dehydrogenase family protein [Bacillota bacterium]
MERPIDSHYKLLIDGKWVDAKDGATFETYCPADGTLLATCAQASQEDVDMAVQAAWKAFETWKDVSPQERSSILLKIADLIDENAEKLALIETLDNGKPIRETRTIDVPLSSDHFRYFAGAIRADEGRAVMIDKNTLSIILSEPIGVVGQIIPWNFPLLMAAWKLAPALAAGCTVVIKPSCLTPLSLLELGKLINEVLPPGVVNIVTGSGATTGQYMLEHPGFRKLAFTGSTEVGYTVAEAAAKKLIPATLELGGKSANIIFPDCPRDKALEGVQIGILFNQGQVCCAGSRVFVHEDIYDEFLADCVDAFSKVKVGLPWEEDTMMGSQINELQLQKILSYVKIGQEEGARLACGGKRLTENGLDKGAFMEPTILADVDNKMRVAQEEIFGPVACFLKFKDEEEVIRLANESEYGLGGAVWTKDINRALRVARGIETGRMWVNDYNNLPAHVPFGGYKKSGIGRETHLMILDHYTQKKSIMISMTEERAGLY